MTSHKHASHTCITTPLSSVRKGTSACSLLQLGYKYDWIHLGVVATKPTVSSTACWQWWVTLINYIFSTFIFISYISILMLSFSVSFLFLYDVILCVISILIWCHSLCHFLYSSVSHAASLPHSFDLSRCIFHSIFINLINTYYYSHFIYYHSLCSSWTDFMMQSLIYPFVSLFSLFFPLSLSFPFSLCPTPLSLSLSPFFLSLSLSVVHMAVKVATTISLFVAVIIVEVICRMRSGEWIIADTHWSTHS